MAEARHDPPFDGIVLDIGDGVGALVIYTSPTLAGREIEVSPSDDEARRIHTEVLERQVGGRTTCAAVFATLAQGTYHIWTTDPNHANTVVIRSGDVAELDWR